MKKVKIFGIVSWIILMLACIVLSSWYLYIKLNGNERIVSNTFEVGLQKTVDGKTKYFIEVNSYDDCFEVKFNYMMDENKAALYSQGIQFYGDNIKFGKSTKGFDLVNKKYKNGALWWKDYTYSQYIKYVLTSGTNYYYMMEDDNKVGMISSNPLSAETFFKIDLDGQLFGMKLKGDNTPMKYEENYEGKYKINNGHYSYSYVTKYYYYDIEYMLQYILSAVESLPYGTDDARVFEFANIFDYYEYNGDGTYDEMPVSLDKADLLESEVKSYYSIKISKHEGNIQKASQSLFGSVAGNSTFNISGIESEDYFYGRTKLSVNNLSFDMVKITEGHVALKLSEEFKNTYSAYADKLELQILIDIDSIKSKGLVFMGFTADSGLNKYNIVSCRSVETINGELVYSGVAYV